MENPSQQLNKTTAILILIIIVFILIFVGVYLFVSNNDYSSDDNVISREAVNENMVLDGDYIIYLVENYVNETIFTPQVYSYDIKSKIHTLLFELENTESSLFDIHTTPRGIIFIHDSMETNNQAAYYDYNGDLIKSISNKNSSNYNIQTNNDGNIFAFQSITVPDYIDDFGPGVSIYRVKIINLSDNSELVLEASDFTYGGVEMQYITPISFSEDNYLYVLASPLFGGEIGDHLIIFRVNIFNKEKETILFTGAESQYDSEKSYDEYIESVSSSIIFNNIYPEHNEVIVKKGLEVPHEILKYDLDTKEYTTLFDPATIDNEADLSTETINLSPDGKMLVIKRGGFMEVSKTFMGSHKGFHILNIDSGLFMRDFLTKGEFVAWLSDTEIIYKDYRDEVWDDVYHTLNIINTLTQKTEDIYTQITDRPYGPDIAKKGDKRYIFVGMVYGGNSKTTKSNNISNSVTDNTSEQVDIPLITIDEIDGSKVIKNSKFGYQFSIPNDWIYDNEASYPDLIAAFDRVGVQQETDTELIQGMKLEIQTGLLNELNGLTIDNYISNREFPESYISENIVSVNGKLSQQKISNFFGYSISTYVVNGDTVVNIIGYIGGSDEIEKYTEVYDEILASFQFI